jgi:hypothetical protein
MSDQPRAVGRRWYRSMYWRIAAGFIAFLALTLVAQVALFLWLSTARDEMMPPRLLADLAALVADELSADAAREPGEELATLARARFEELGRPAVLLFPDGRVVSADGREPPEPMLRATAARLRRFGDTPGAWTQAPRRPGQRGRPGTPAGFGAGGVPRGGLPGAAWAAGSALGRVVVIESEGHPLRVIQQVADKIPVTG